jgi:hypothetical protein
MNNQHAFLNRVRSLFNIDGYRLPELTEEQRGKFLRDPVRYFIGADDMQAAAIWREIEKRQKPAPDAAPDMLAALHTILNHHAGSLNTPAYEAAMSAIAKAESPALQATGEQS